MNSMPIMDDLTIKYDIPTEINSKFTKEIMTDFRQEVIEVFKKNDIRQGRTPFDYENYTYYHWWLWMEDTSGWYDAFKYTCDKYHLTDVIKYYNSLPWHDSDLFNHEFGDLLI